jgi:hypothetical protein
MSLTLAALLCSACHSNQSQTAENPNQSSQDQSGDPANANLAPVSDNSSGASAPTDTVGSAPQDSGGSSDQAYDESDYGEQPAETASQPPPPLPEYDQPPAPGDDYLWTPGYWSYASQGYYWVPGVWVQAPYTGALWTPGYWGYRHNHYEFFRGYWGPHIGYYGGINYGFGYVGVGYQGGYWRGDHFDYNRSVNNVNVTVVHNVYNYSVVNRNTTRVSFNGGSGGVQARPRPAELAALHESHAPPMSAQLQNQRLASTNRTQFASVNHGRPANMAVSRPIAADHNVRPVAPPPMRNQPAQTQNGRVQERANPAPAPRVSPENRGQPAAEQPNRHQPAPAQPSHSEPGRAAPERPAPPQHQVKPERPAPQHQPAPVERAAPNHQPPPEHRAAPPRPAAPEHKAAPKPQASHEKPKPEDKQKHQD